MSLIDKIRPLIKEQAHELLKTQPQDFNTLKEAIESVVESLIDDLDGFVEEID